MFSVPPLQDTFCSATPPTVRPGTALSGHTMPASRPPEPSAGAWASVPAMAGVGAGVGDRVGDGVAVGEVLRVGVKPADAPGASGFREYRQVAGPEDHEASTAGHNDGANEQAHNRAIGCEMLKHMNWNVVWPSDVCCGVPPSDDCNLSNARTPAMRRRRPARKKTTATAATKTAAARINILPIPLQWISPKSVAVTKHGAIMPHEGYWEQAHRPKNLSRRCAGGSDARAGSFDSSCAPRF